MYTAPRSSGRRQGRRAYRQRHRRRRAGYRSGEAPPAARDALCDSAPVAQISVGTTLCSVTSWPSESCCSVVRAKSPTLGELTRTVSPNNNARHDGVSCVGLRRWACRISASRTRSHYAQLGHRARAGRSARRRSSRRAPSPRASSSCAARRRAPPRRRPRLCCAELVLCRCGERQWRGGRLAFDSPGHPRHDRSRQRWQTGARPPHLRSLARRAQRGRTFSGLP